MNYMVKLSSPVKLQKSSRKFFLNEWVKVNVVADKYRQDILELQVDRCEASAIALCLEHPDCLLIIDDDKARRIAKKLNITIAGTIGVIVKSKLNGVVPSVRPIMEKIKDANFRISSEIETAALEIADEIQ